MSALHGLDLAHDDETRTARRPLQGMMLLTGVAQMHSCWSALHRYCCDLMYGPAKDHVLPAFPSTAACQNTWPSSQDVML